MDELLEMFRSSILEFVRKYSIVIPSPLSNNDAGEHERTWRSKFLKASEEWATVGYLILMCLYIVQLQAANNSSGITQRTLLSVGTMVPISQARLGTVLGTMI